MSPIDRAFDFFIDLWQRYISTLSSFTFEVFDIEVNIVSIIVAFLVAGFVINKLWKGAQT